MKKLLMAGGGTGGHIYPAIAILENIKKDNGNMDVFFIGTRRGPGKKMLADLGINFSELNAYGLALRGNIFVKTKSLAKFSLYLFFAFFKALIIILRFKPDMILGMGGYICAPVLLAAILLRKKFALHEQNFIPGRLNYFFSRFAGIVFTSFKETKKFLRTDQDKIIYSGNPVRQDIKNITRMPDEKEYKRWGLKNKRFTITAFGGSLGAEKINSSVAELCKMFNDRADLQIILICGNRFFDILKEKFSSGTERNSKLIFKILPYVDKIEQIYNISDLLITRAGANTIFEIIAANIPAILIPYPEAVANHQYYNAEFLANSGKALMIEDKELSGNKLKELIGILLDNEKEKYLELKLKTIDSQEMESDKIILRKLMEI